MPSKEIARISMPGRERFFQEYVFKRQPIVITNLFEQQPISNINTIDEATRAWGTMNIYLQEEYTSAEGTAQPAQPIFMSFSEYVDFTRSNRSTRLCCTEYETPARILASFKLPPACTVTTLPDDEVFCLPKKYGDFDLATNVFIANRGNVAHLHFDGDQREVLLHQVYGRKRVVLFQPAAAIHLRTLDGPFTRPSLSGLYLENMSLEEKLEHVDLADGYHTVLEPGETIYIPMLMWHHVEYLDDAMSFSVRFGRTRFGRFLSLDNFHRDPYIQNVASKIAGPADVLETFDPIIEDIKTMYMKPAPDIRQKTRQVRTLFRELCAQLCPDAFAERLCPPEREEEQVSRIVSGNDMKGGLKYVDPALIARTRPAGAITSRQMEIIRDGIRKVGYAKEVEQAVIFNRVGKVDVNELTKAEAAQLIAYLRTPGAAW
jgi:lysine-specific demethylase 8